MNELTIHQVHRERKFQVDDAEASRLESMFERHLPVRPRFDRERSARIRGTYLDFDDRSLTRRALATPHDSQKVRYRRYEQLALSRGTGEASVLVWIEVKVRRGELVTKERAAVHGALLPRLLEGAAPPPPDATALQGLLARGRLRPVVALHYVRLAFEAPDESLRLTIDRDIAFRLPDRPGDDAPDVARFDGCIVEIKSTGAIPDWLEEVLRDHPAAAISKFELALHATGTAG